MFAIVISDVNWRKLSQSVLCFAEVIGVSAAEHASHNPRLLGNMREAPRMGGLKRCACVAEVGLCEFQVQRQSAVLINRHDKLKYQYL